MWKKSQVCSLYIINSQSNGVTLNSSFRRQAVHSHCAEEWLHPFAMECRVWHLHCLLEETDLFFVVENNIVSKAKGAKYLKIRVKYSEREPSAWKTDDRGFLQGLWVA